MILYDFQCQNRHRFEAGLPSMFADNPPCPVCATPTHRVPPRIQQLGKSDTGPSFEEMPKSWQAISGGHPDAVAHWRKKIEKREKLAERHPELAGDRRPVLAHEGIFAGRPLRAGDDIGKSVESALKATKKPRTEAE